MRAHDQHRTGSVPDHFLGDAAEQRSRHAGASVARYDDEVGGPFFCLLDNCRAWDARLHKFVRGGRQRKAIAETTEQSLALLFGSAVFRRRIVDIDESDFAAERAAKLAANSAARTDAGWSSTAIRILRILIVLSRLKKN